MGIFASSLKDNTPSQKTTVIMNIHKPAQIRFRSERQHDITKATVIMNIHKPAQIRFRSERQHAITKNDGNHEHSQTCTDSFPF